MSLVDQIQKDITTAMKARDEARLSTLRMVKSALMNRKIEKMADLDDKEAQQVLSTLIKQRKDSVEQFRAGGRQDLVDREQAEITFLQRYLPAEADEATVLRAIDAAIAETSATGPKDMGKVMKATMAGLAGATVDGRVVSELVKKRLSPS
jgi:uncharacterized protein YqeY